ncbi:uncharacterized protein LOC118349208 [Juglans regia]|uniref:Uncharacterized protein LOC118349208 n=1 Tax=Juglans regia TaxID=51240 RepID=A0A6P9F1Q6_JUGRE|nr:uncharacterized protein LOC118349208 [Juglans regia]
MRAAQSRQKSYADNRRHQLEFEVGDKVFLRIAPMRGVMRKYVPDPTHVIDYEPLQFQEDLTYTEEPVRIVERKEQVLRNRTIPLVKVVWNNYAISEVSWELEEEMQVKYPQLFDDDPNSL